MVNNLCESIAVTTFVSLPQSQSACINTSKKNKEKRVAKVIRSDTLKRLMDFLTYHYLL